MGHITGNPKASLKSIATAPGASGGAPTLGSKPITGVQPTCRTSRCCKQDHRWLTFQQSHGFSTPASRCFQSAAASNTRSSGKLKAFQSPVPDLGSTVLCMH